MNHGEENLETRYPRPAISDAISEMLDKFVEPLMSMKVVDIDRLFSGAIDRWLEQCSLGEMLLYPGIDILKRALLQPSIDRP